MEARKPENLNAAALQALTDFNASAHVVAGYLEYGVGVKALADNLNAAQTNIEAPTEALFNYMRENKQHLLDPDSGEEATFDQFENDYHKYYYAFVSDNGYLSTGDPLKRMDDVMKSLDEAIQLTLVANAQAINYQNEPLRGILNATLQRALFSRNILGLVLMTGPHPHALMFVPDNYLQRNASFTISAMKDFDGIKMKLPTPVFGQAFIDNDDQSVVPGRMTIPELGEGTTFSTESADDMDKLMKIYLETISKWIQGLE